MTFRWIERRVADPERITRMQTELNGIDRALARALIIRGIDSFEKARRFFRPSTEHLQDPFAMRDMDRAAERVVAAIRDRESVLVYGDYDVDGTTATALVTAFLRSHSATASFFIPDRIENGYGLSRAGIDVAAERGASVIVALDCGVTAVEEAEYARRHGIDLIVCDHHTVKHQLPDAYAVLDPKRPDCTYPFKELSGCGIGFKLVQAITSLLGEDQSDLEQYLDLVALSIGSDIVPLNGENRVLMQEGLRRLRTNASVGLRALANGAGVDLGDCSTSQIVFALGPRINAAGRLGDAGRAVELMLATDYATAQPLAGILEETNERRRGIDRDTVEQAVAMLEQTFHESDTHGIVLHDHHWHPGVIGIVASRVVERFVRPAVLLTTINGLAKGSARSIPGVNIFEALRQCDDLLEEFGGHDYAAGLTLKPENIEPFRERFDEAVSEMATDDLFVASIDYDAAMDLSSIDGRFWAVLRQFAPHGPTNDDPVFRSDGLRVLGRPRTVGQDDKHLKFVVRQRDSRPMEVIAFGLGDRIDILEKSRDTGQPIDMLFSVSERTWNGRRSLQLKGRDVRLSSAPA